jgi:hypothetical protein
MELYLYSPYMPSWRGQGKLCGLFNAVFSSWRQRTSWRRMTFLDDEFGRTWKNVVVVWYESGLIIPEDSYCAWENPRQTSVKISGLIEIRMDQLPNVSQNFAAWARFCRWHRDRMLPRNVFIFLTYYMSLCLRGLLLDSYRHEHL